MGCNAGHPARVMEEGMEGAVLGTLPDVKQWAMLGGLPGP